MSRSFKKTAYCGDNKGKLKKRRANDKVKSFFKKNPEIKISRGDFRKIQNPWDICDFYDIESFETYWNFELTFYEANKDIYNLPEPNKKEAYRNWYKAYKMK